jgi:3-hydroxyacyl-[acyl-carrier-protein] dehydratase
LLLNNLYSIQSMSESDDQILATVRLMADHAIFGGHFPGQPVLPGVCMMEMVAEIVGECRKVAYRVSAGPLIKFLRMIDPRINPEIQIEIKYNTDLNTVHTSGRIFSGTEVFMKFQLSLVPEPVA